MTIKTLKEKGKLLEEKDYFNGGIYLYTMYLYEYNGENYIVEEHSNANTFTGNNCCYPWNYNTINEYEGL